MSLRAVADLQTYGLADSLAGPLEDIAIDTECKEIDYEVHLRRSIDAVDFTMRNANARHNRASSAWLLENHAKIWTRTLMMTL